MKWAGISRENLMKVSGNTYYKKVAYKHANVLSQADKYGSQPIVVAKTIVRAAIAKKSRTGYPTGDGAKIVLFLRKILSDRMFDRLMLGIMNKAGV